MHQHQQPNGFSTFVRSNGWGRLQLFHIPTIRKWSFFISSILYGRLYLFYVRSSRTSLLLRIIIIIIVAVIIVVITRGIFDFDIAYIAYIAYIRFVWQHFFGRWSRRFVFFSFAFASVRLKIFSRTTEATRRAYRSACRRFGALAAQRQMRWASVALLNSRIRSRSRRRVASCRKRRRRRSFGNSANFFTHCR